ncbi:MAG: glycosyltransferase [Deltaproteobacteria bacterium]|nr:glycosyltransferase [Deltaproteobacteria bacterium]
MKEIARTHILIITYNDYPVYEGLGVRIENLAQVYTKSGYKVIIFAPNIENKRERKEELNGYKVMRAIIPVPKWLLRYRIPARAYSMLLQTLLTFFVYFKYLRKERIDVIQAEHVYSIPPALIIKAFTGARVFVDDIITVSDMLRSQGNTIISRLFMFMEKTLFRMCDEFTYTSDVCRDYCEKRGGRATVFVPNGVDCSRFIPGYKKEKDKKVIFFNCSTYSSQNIDAIKNFLLIGRLLRKQTDIPFILHLISSPIHNIPVTLMEEIKKENEWFLLEEGVPDIASRISNADITVLPYSPGHHLTGGVRLKALEYMACGKPVLSTPEGVEGINGLIPGKHAVVTKTPEEMVSLLLDFLESDRDFNPIAIDGRNFVKENFDWERVATPMLERLKNI